MLETELPLFKFYYYAALELLIASQMIAFINTVYHSVFKLHNSFKSGKVLYNKYNQVVFFILF